MVAINVSVAICQFVNFVHLEKGLLHDCCLLEENLKYYRFCSLDYWPFNQLVCDIWNILDHILCITSISTVVYISIERFISIKYPLKHKATLSKRKSIIHLSSTWMVNGVFWSLYIGLTQYYFGKNRDLKSCTVYFLNYVGFALFNAMVLILSTVVNIVVYVSIYFMTRQGMKVRKSFKETNTNNVNSVTITGRVSSITMTDKNDSEDLKGTNNIKSVNRKVQDSSDRKAIRTIALLLITFAVCWMPLAFVFITEAIKPG